MLCAYWRSVSVHFSLVLVQPSVAVYSSAVSPDGFIGLRCCLYHCQSIENTRSRFCSAEILLIRLLLLFLMATASIKTLSQQLLHLCRTYFLSSNRIMCSIVIKCSAIAVFKYCYRRLFFLYSEPLFYSSLFFWSYIVETTFIWDLDVLRPTLSFTRCSIFNFPLIMEECPINMFC